MHEFAKNSRLATANAFNTAIADGKFPASGSFISADSAAWWVFLVRVGTLNSALTVQLQQDTGATQTASIKNVTGAVLSIGATDDNDLFVLEIEVKAALDIANSFTHMTLDISGAGGSDDYLDIIYFGCHTKTVPVTQPATTNVVVLAG